MFQLLYRACITDAFSLKRNDELFKRKCISLNVSRSDDGGRGLYEELEFTNSVVSSKYSGVVVLSGDVELGIKSR